MGQKAGRNCYLVNCKVETTTSILNQSDCDSFITLQIMLDSHIYDKAVLITSDGDFDNLVKRLLLQDKLRIIFAPCKEGCSWLLKSAAKGRIAFIDDYRDELEKI